MATAFDWIRLILRNWAVIVPICLFLASATGLSFSMVDNADKDEEIKVIQNQVREVAKYYMELKPEKPIVHSCSKCMDEVKRLREEFH